MAENIKLAFVLFFKFFCLFLGNFQFSDQEKRYAYQLRQWQNCLILNFALIFYIKRKVLETENRQKELTRKQNSQQVRRYPKGSFYMSQVFRPKQNTSHDTDTIYQRDWKPGINLREIRENGEDRKQKTVLIFKKKNKVDSENNRLVNLMLTYSRILKRFIK